MKLMAEIMMKQYRGQLKIKKDMCHFRCTSVSFFGEIISWNGVQPDPQKVKALMEMPPPKVKKELQDSWVLLII